MKMSITCRLCLSLISIQVSLLCSAASDFQSFPDARLIEHPSNDGDSFIVDANGRTFHVRLYFVDCPETMFTAPSDTRRVREQMRYFGLSDPSRTIHYGKKAKLFVDGILAEPFTLHTAFARALGRSAEGRIYGFITAADGKDLASLLVKQGLARVHGIGRQTPDGVPRNEMIEYLRDLEISAMLKRAGIWAESDPDRIAELRAEQRSEEKELKELQDRIRDAMLPTDLLDPNTAGSTELQSLKGIGPVIAERIISARPYDSVDDLLEVEGIGPGLFESIRPYFRLDTGADEPEFP